MKQSLLKRIERLERMIDEKERELSLFPQMCWGDAGAILTAEEVVAGVMERGVDLNIVTLRYWQKIGAFPIPTKRWSDGATRALYPPEAIDLAVKIREWQDVPREEMLRRYVRTWFESEGAE